MRGQAVQRSRDCGGVLYSNAWMVMEMNPKKAFSEYEQPGVTLIFCQMGEYVGNVLLLHVRTWQNYPKKLNQRNNLSKNEPTDHCHTKSTDRGIYELFTHLI